MSLKSLSKTRWSIEPGRVTVYPYGLSYILASILAIIFAAGYLVYIYYLQNSVGSSLPLLLVLIVIISLFVGWAGTSIEFDINEGVMRKKLMGFLPISTIPFSHIYGINPVSNLTGSYTYRVFKKDNRYGKGLLVSCAYGKNNDPNALAFVDEVITPIHHYLEAHDGPEDFKPINIERYTFFNVEGSAYIVKKNKFGSLILGLALLAIGIHELTPGAWLGDGWTIGRICFMLLTLIGGPAIMLAGFTDVRLDINSRLLTRTNPTGLGNCSYSFDDFNGLQTVRKSTNFIYSGTDVRAYFLKPGSQKEVVIVLQSFFSTRKVERFVAEVNSIIV
ncbi:hypothetical protein [Pedobacter mendelii]|uniref:PH domain-containing protein n=1 Tax=Pedobacter mendelii TaxID=1908240 RepID=A0ABQ2BN70_9SPHI|nr:hypothetical protein [Pedobacter mendelii]GGI28623.1 hypothetical protein GCM10008119_33570 [Pedobacter mendelii]